MRLAKLACSAFLLGAPLLGQLQFFNPDAPWFTYPPAVATDSAGNTYVVSRTSAAGGITATKFDASQHVLYTFSLAAGDSYPTAAAVDSHGALIIGGWTGSASFPRVNALFYPRLPTSVIDQRGFVAKLDPGGSSLMFSTLVGGNELDYHYATLVNALAVDSADRIYLVGSTSSPTLPVSANAVQPTGGDAGGNNTSGFVMRLSNAGDALQFSTYLGGVAPGCFGCRTQTQAVIIDSHGITLAGTSDPKGISATKGAYDCHCAGVTATNVFVSRFSADGNTLQWSALLFDLGSQGLQLPRLSLSVDRQGNATVAASTTNKALLATPGAVQPDYRVVDPPPYASWPSSGYLSAISADGTTLLHSTYYGGRALSTLRAVAQDPDGNYWITGDAYSTDLPMPPGSLNLGTSYLAELDPTLTRVLRYYGVPIGAIGQTLNMLPNRDLILSGTANSVLRIPANGLTQPSVLGAAGAAEPAVTPHIAAGELISLYGVQLGPDPGVGGSVESGKVANGIAGYQVRVNGIPAPLLYAGPNQINLVVPFGIASGTQASIQVITPKGALAPVTGFSVGPTQPQVFPVMLNQDGSINSRDHPAPRNSIVTIWATGTGPMDAGMVDGQIGQPPLGKLLLPVIIELSRFQPADVPAIQYAGAAPGLVAGVAQINFQVPPVTYGHGSCHEQCSVVLSVGGRNALATFPFSGNVFTTPDPVVWVSEN